MSIEQVRTGVVDLLRLAVEFERRGGDPAWDGLLPLQQVLGTLQRHRQRRQMEEDHESAAHLAVELSEIYAQVSTSTIAGHDYEEAVTSLFRRYGFELTPDALDELVVVSAEIYGADRYETGPGKCAAHKVGLLLERGQRSVQSWVGPVRRQMESKKLGPGATVLLPTKPPATFAAEALDAAMIPVTTKVGLGSVRVWGAHSFGCEVDPGFLGAEEYFGALEDETDPQPLDRKEPVNMDDFERELMAAAKRSAPLARLRSLREQAWEEAPPCAEAPTAYDDAMTPELWASFSSERKARYWATYESSAAAMVAKVDAGDPLAERKMSFYLRLEATAAKSRLLYGPK